LFFPVAILDVNAMLINNYRLVIKFRNKGESVCQAIKLDLDFFQFFEELLQLNLAE